MSVTLQTAIVQTMRDALLSIEFSVKGCCPNCGEDKEHYRGCKVKIALDASKLYMPRRVSRHE